MFLAVKTPLLSNRLFMGCEERFVEYQMNELLVGKATGFPPDTSLHNRHSLHGRPVGYEIRVSAFGKQVLLDYPVTWNQPLVDASGKTFCWTRSVGSQEALEQEGRNHKV
jgi:hypothetical protein